MAVRQIQIDITVEGGQLHQQFHDEADRLMMITRLQDILVDAPSDLRGGAIQVLLDQMMNNDAHVPIIIRTGLDPTDSEEQLVWNCDHADIEVDIGKFRHTPRTPHQPGLPDNPFQFNNGRKSKRVASGAYKSRQDSIKQRFYKFSVEGKDLLGNDLTLDPCIICEK